MLDPFIDRMMDIILTSESRFAAGIAFSILSVIYVLTKIYKVLSKFIQELLDLFIVKKRQMDQLEVEKERTDLDIQKLALDNLRKTSEHHTLTSKDLKDSRHDS